MKREDIRNLLGGYAAGTLTPAEQKLLFDAALEEAGKLSDIFGAGNFYLELQDHGLPGQQKVNPLLLEVHRKTGIPYVCTNDAHYLRRDDSFAHDVLLCIGTGKSVAEPNRMRYASDQFYFKSPDEMKEAFKDTPEAIANTIEIAERCNFEMKLGENHLPEYPAPPDTTLDDIIVEKAKAGQVELQTKLDKAQKLHSWHKNTIARKKSRLAKKLNAIAGASKKK